MVDFATRRTVMVDTQVRPSDVTKFTVIDAMLHVRREVFVPDDRRDVAYAGGEIPLKAGRAVPDPRVLAKMLDALDPGPQDLVLDIGCGSGYSSAVIGHMAEAVIALEEDETLAAEAEENLATEAVDNAVVVNAPLAEGAAKHGPYDAIFIGGGIEVLPDAIAGQLKEGGRIVALYMQGVSGKCRLGVKADGRIAWRTVFDASAQVLPGFERERGFTL